MVVSSQISPRAVAGRFRFALKSVVDGGPSVMPSLGSQTLDEDDVDLAKALLADPTSWLDAEAVFEFEDQFASWNGSAHAFAFRSGRESLSAAIQGLGLSPGDDVIVPGYTCVVVPNAFSYAGIEPTYADIELDTYGVDIAEIRRLVTTSTKAIVMHHLYGLVSRDYDAIVEFAAERGIPVIEDCAHSTGATVHGVNVGNRGTVGFYSSEQSKVFNTIMGGVVVTSDEHVARRLEAVRSDAPAPTHDEIKSLLMSVRLRHMQEKSRNRLWLTDVAALRFGKHEITPTSIDEYDGLKPDRYGEKMAGATAKLAVNQLRKIDAYNEERRAHARHWDAWADAQGYRKPLVVEDTTPVFLRYPVQVPAEMKADLRWARTELGVRPGVWFLGTHHPVNRNEGLCPNADLAVRTVINMPTLGLSQSQLEGT